MQGLAGWQTLGMGSGLWRTQAVLQSDPEGPGNTVLAALPLPRLHTLTI